VGVCARTAYPACGGGRTAATRPGGAGIEWFMTDIDAYMQKLREARSRPSADGRREVQ